jgi:hypothetical protein
LRKLQINIVDNWKKHLADGVRGKELGSDIENEDQLRSLSKAEKVIRDNIDLFIEGLKEEGIPIPDEFNFNLLIEDDRWFIAEHNCQIIYEVS